MPSSAWQWIKCETSAQRIISKWKLPRSDADAASTTLEARCVLKTPSNDTESTTKYHKRTLDLEYSRFSEVLNVRSPKTHLEIQEAAVRANLTRG